MGHARLPALGVAVMLTAGVPAAASFAQPAAYRVTPPMGWTRSVEADTLVFAAPGEPAGTATLMLLPVKPLERDFDAQFARERAALERVWTLRDAQQAPPQRGRSAAGEFAASFASYASDRGDRYVSWFALGDKGAFALVVFVATSSAAYNRGRGPAGDTFNALFLTDEARRLAGAGATLASSASTTPSKPAAAAVPAPSNPPPPGNLPAELIGVWAGSTARSNVNFQMGTTTGAWGNTVQYSSLSMSAPVGSGGRVLKIRADGRYEFAEDRALGPCWRTVAHEGRAAVQGTQLVLQPARHREVATKQSAGARCDVYDRDVPLAPISYALTVESTGGTYGFPTFGLTLKWSDDYFYLQRIDGRPLGEAQPRPSDFQPGKDLAYREVAGTWVAPEDASSAPPTSPAGDQGKYRAVLRLLGDGQYEITVARPNAVNTPVCQKSVLLVEHGSTRLSIAVADGRQAVGRAMLVPTRSRLTETVSRCGSDDGTRSVDLPLHPRYFDWTLNTERGLAAAPSAGDRFDLRCPARNEERGPTQYLFCQELAQVYGGYVRR